MPDRRIRPGVGMARSVVGPRARRVSGYADGLVSGATWGLVGVLLTMASTRMAGCPLVAIALVVAAGHDATAALFLLGRSRLRGGLRRVATLVVSREAGAVIACSLLGGPIFMGAYVASMILAGPSVALTLTATYPVFGAVLADRLLRQRLSGLGWLAVGVTTVGAALTAFDVGSAPSGVVALLGLVLALVGAIAVALEGIFAYRVMITADPEAVLVLRQLIAAVLFAIAVVAVPGGLAAASALARPEIGSMILVAGAVGGYSYAVWYRAMRKIGVAKAMTLNITYAVWGVLLAAMIGQTSTSPFAIIGCLVVVAGACLTILAGRRRSVAAAAVAYGGHVRLTSATGHEHQRQAPAR